MLPYSLDLLSDCLPGIDVPDSPFDPKGEWVHNYAVWNPARGKKAKSELAGSLRIRRGLTTGGNLRLQLTQVIKMQGLNGTGNTKADTTCTANDLATPIRWKLDSEIANSQGEQVKYTSVSVSGEAAGGTIVLHGEKDTRMRYSGKLSSSWSLFDAVQRLPFDTKALEFGMLEELELLKPDQRLWPGETVDVRLGKQMVRLRSFEQIGTGILPFTYWLDEQHRLIIAVSQRRAYLLDSTSEDTGGAK